MIVQESIARDIVRLIVWYPIRWVVRIIPISSAYRLFALMGTIHYKLSRRLKKRIPEMMQLGLKDLTPVPSPYQGEGSRRGEVFWQKQTEKYLQIHYINQMQIFVFPSIRAQTMSNYHHFTGLEHLDKVREQNKGAILLHAHFGPAHLTLQALGLKGYPMIQVGLPVEEGLSFIGRRVAFRLRMKYEKKIKAEIIPATSFLRPVIRGLKENHVIMTTGDGAGGGRFVGEFIPLDFLGQKLEFATGPVNLSRRTGALLLPTFTLQDRVDYFHTIIHPPLDSNENRSPADIMQDWAKIFEDYLIQYPYLWHFWDEFDQRIDRAKSSIK
jgi:phosphatidylinositol dimannoside acyltransferase